MVVHHRFSEEELVQALSLFDRLDLLLSQVDVSNAVSVRSIDVVEIFKQGLRSMDCTRDELDLLWMFFSSAATAAIEAGNGDMFSGLDDMLGRETTLQ